MDLIGTCSVSTWKKTIEDVLESRGLMEPKPTTLLEMINDGINDALDSIKDGINTALDSIKDRMSNAFVAYKDGMNNAFDCINSALISVGLITPKPTLWDSFLEEMKLHSWLLVWALLLAILSASLILKAIVSRRNKKKLFNMNLRRCLGETVNEETLVDDFLHGLSDDYSLPDDLNKEEMRGVLRLFEKYIMEKNG